MKNEDVTTEKKYRKLNIEAFQMQCKKKHPQVYYILISLVLVILTAIFVMSYYNTVLSSMDDVGMRNIISGLYTGTPDGHAYFMYYGLSRILADLYVINSNISWYRWFLLVANYGCMVLLIYRVVEKFIDDAIKAAVISVLIFLTFWINNLVFLEWTATTGIMAATAVFWYGTIPEECGKWRRILEYFFPLFLLFLAYNLRHSVAEMFMPIAGLVFLGKLFINGKRNRKFIFRELLYLVICCVCVIGSYYVNDRQYQGEKWDNAKNFLTVRSMMFDWYGYPNYEEYEEIYVENGISKAEYECLKEDYNFTLVCTGVNNAEGLRKIADKAKELYDLEKSISQRIIISIQQRWKNFFDKNYGIYNIVYCLEILAILWIAVKERNWKYIFWLSVFEITFEMLWLYLYYKGRLPERVGYCLCIGQIMVTLFVLWNTKKFHEIFAFASIKVVALFIVGICIGTSFSTVKRTNQNVLITGQTLSETRKYCEEHSENLYLRDFNSFRYSDIMKGKSEQIAANMRPFNDWTVNFPLKTAIAPLDGSQELCSWISNESNVYLLVDETRGEGVCERQKELFLSRGIECEVVLEDEIHISNNNVIEVYHYISN